MLGALTCLGAAPRRLTSGETQLLEALSGQLAVAIENSNLYEALNSKIHELQCNTLELERANRVKDDFLGVVSHELRTPINVISVGSRRRWRNSEQEAALATIARQATNCLPPSPRDRAGYRTYHDGTAGVQSERIAHGVARQLRGPDAPPVQRELELRG